MCVYARVCVHACVCTPVCARVCVRVYVCGMCVCVCVCPMHVVCMRSNLLTNVVGKVSQKTAWRVVPQTFQSTTLL